MSGHLKRCGVRKQGRQCIGARTLQGLLQDWKSQRASSHSGGRQSATVPRQWWWSIVKVESHAKAQRQSSGCRQRNRAPAAQLRILSSRRADFATPQASELVLEVVQVKEGSVLRPWPAPLPSCCARQHLESVPAPITGTRPGIAVLAYTGHGWSSCAMLAAFIGRGTTQEGRVCLQACRGSTPGRWLLREARGWGLQPRFWARQGNTALIASREPFCVDAISLCDSQLH